MPFSLFTRLVGRYGLVWLMFFAGLLLVLHACRGDPLSEPHPYQEDLALERALREKAEEDSAAAQEEATQAKQRAAWCAGLGIAGMVTALVIGTAIGSKARKDAKNSQKGGPPA